MGKGSKLSRGPKNPHHTTFLNNEKLIRRFLDKVIAKRLIYVRARDLCRAIKISRPTFYLHHRNCNHAREAYEQALLKEFCTSVARTNRREVAITLLLSFVQSHSGYFTAAAKACDSYVMVHMVYHIRPILVGNNISDPAFKVYAGVLNTIIVCWGEYENYSTASLPLYTNKLLRVRVMAF